MTKWSVWGRSTCHISWVCCLRMWVQMLIHWYLCDIIVTSPISIFTWIRHGLIILQLHHAHILYKLILHGHDRKDRWRFKRQPPVIIRDIGWTVKYLCVWGCVHVCHNTSEGIADVVNRLALQMFQSSDPYLSNTLKSNKNIWCFI